MNSFILIKPDGSQQETPFLLKNGVPCISEHVFCSEFGEHDDKGNWVPEIPIRAFEPTLKLFEAIREIVGQPIAINSGYRTIEKQKYLYKADLESNGGKPSGKVANPANAPHTTGTAMDLSLPAGYTAQQLAQLIRQTSVKLGYPMARTGYITYDYKFVHFDLVFLLYAPYTKTPNPAPALWFPGGSW
jgi:hypothetical protein